MILPSKPAETSLLSSSLTQMELTVALCRSKINNCSLECRLHTTISPSSYPAYILLPNRYTTLTGTFLFSLYRYCYIYPVLAEIRATYWLTPVMNIFSRWLAMYNSGRRWNCKIWRWLGQGPGWRCKWNILSPF